MTAIGESCDLPSPRMMRAVVCSCAETDTPGMVEDEGWWSTHHGSIERTLGAGLIECGFCDGDGWWWDHTDERAYTLGELNTEGTRSFIRGMDEGAAMERQRCLAIIAEHRKHNDPDLAANSISKRQVFASEGAVRLCDEITAEIGHDD